MQRRLEALEEDPRPAWAKPLKAVNPPLWRFRVSGWRVLYEIDDATRTVTVRDVERRDKVYRGL